MGACVIKSVRERSLLTNGNLTGLMFSLNGSRINPSPISLAVALLSDKDKI